MKDGTYADFSSDGTAKTADGTVVKQAGVEDYNWKAGCGIEKVVIERIDFTIKKNKRTRLPVLKLTANIYLTANAIRGII